VTIPHFVPSHAHYPPSENQRVVVFGFFTPEKGQDIIIKAWRQIGLPRAKLLLAGGARRPEDKVYLEGCRKLIREGGLDDSISITGYLPSDQIDQVYAEANLVVAPFRDTSGSGSLAQAFARGAAVLASDLPLNREIAERVDGCLALFPTESEAGCAENIRRLLLDGPALAKLSSAARRYADRFSTPTIAKEHLSFYDSVLG
ncbi:MAG: glycosyltransferase, partial [Proteobacteria bacterium]